MLMAIRSRKEEPSMRNPVVTHFFDEPTNTFSYVRSANAIVDFIEREGLSVEWILETHVHADHLSAAPYLHDKLGGKTGIGAHIRDVQEIFGKAFNAGTEF